MVNEKIITTLDDVTPSTGSILYFDGSSWVHTSPGADGYVLQSNGDGYAPTWEQAESGGINVDGASHGDLIYYNGSEWDKLDASDDGYVLVTHGDGYAPTWEQKFTDWQKFDVVADDNNGNPLDAGTGGTISGIWRRVGDSIDLNFKIIFGTALIDVGGGTGGVWRFSLPPGLTIDRNFFTNNITGNAWMLDESSSTRYAGAPSTVGSNDKYISVFTSTSSASGFVRNNSPFYWTTLDRLFIHIAGLKIIEFS